MSIVACKVSEKEIEISSDSICVRGYTQEKSGERMKFSKLVQINNMIIGGVGLSAENGLMQLFAATHQPLSPTEDALLSFIAEFSEWKKKRTEKHDIENNFIIAFSGHAFRLDGFSIKEILTYDSIGSGKDFALAALYLGHDTIKAVETACELSIYCEKPIITFRSKK